ncbi:polysaccharide biosynthesis tyrosine autokinase [Litoribacter alkaliphilus]|uniref:non-specific protein-tyrosine kinase n=1 Tax=Litoribacter ruber TaxID=702568 RepID=A0AAP2CL22_9BACT|nr:polysaccharide biosynthesis tyrosine autokinase [Litoribacter alkaliphilus]MBS9524520.1 polysaccharide biosynthesis tyrosine autokinase [Litoribacter alkaliphilus]
MYYNKHNHHESEENLLTSIINKYLPYWPLFAFLLILSMSAALLLHRHTTPVYKITATLLIKDEQRGVDDARMLESMNAFASKKIVENEIEVLQSRALLKTVVSSLKLYAPIFEELQFKSLPAFTTSPIQIELEDPNTIIQGSGKAEKIPFTFHSEKGVVLLEGKTYPIDKWHDTPYGKMRFTLNEFFTEQSRSPLYFSLIHPKKVIDEIQKKMEVLPVNKLSTVVNIYYKDQVPSRGEEILNRLIGEYNKASHNERNMLATNTMNFLEERLATVEQELEDLEKVVQQYKTTKGVVDLSEQGKMYLQNVGDYDRRIADINMQLSVLDNIEVYVRSKEKNGGIVPSTLGLNDAILTQLLEKLYESEIQYERLKRTTAENNPILLSIQNEIEKIRPGILENVNNQRANLQASLGNLTANTGRFNAALGNIPQQERELLELNRRKAIKNDLFSYLLQKREETALTYAPSEADSRLIDAAESVLRPVNPRPEFLFPLAFILPFILGVTIVTGKEMLSNKILYRSDIEAYTDTPVLSELSHITRKRKRQYPNYNDPLLAEQFRDLAVNSGLFVKDKYKKIMLTSVLPGEGKSFVSANLAVNLAKLGKRVVLVDLDTRNPNTSVQFGCFKKLGLTDYLSSETKADAIVHSTNYPNLCLIPSGKELGENTKLLLHEKLGKILRVLEASFDYIIIDTPPISLVADAYFISNYCDKSFLVVRHNYTPKNVIKHLDQSSKLKNLMKVGIIFNGIKVRGMFSKQYGYGYGYNFNPVKI